MIYASKPCARDGCERQVLASGPPYKIFGRREEYCSHDCVTLVVEEIKRKKTHKPSPTAEDVAKEVARQIEKAMQVPADDFGDVGIVRRYCDNPVCRLPITLCWKGRHGEYHNNDCLKLMEKSGEKKMPETTTTNEAATTDPKPIQAVRSAKKNAAPAKKAAAPAKKPAKADKNGAVTLDELLAGPAKKGLDLALARKELSAAQVAAVSIMRIRLNEAYARNRAAAK